MSTHKSIDRICCVVLAVTLLLTFLFINAEKLGIQKASTVMAYESKLFDTTKVHTIDIIMDDWDEFLANCQSEEYYNCAVVIDNDAYKNVAIRGKGNTSLTQVSSYGNNRYSFKIEFDHYDSSNTYYGLDKLCLNNIIQDNTYLKDYLTYQMMAEMGVASPLCSFVYITVNGEDWGLYLAVEGVEESFLQRNYGNDYGKLYKPDSQSMGGGRGNGEEFDFDDFFDNNNDTKDFFDIQMDDNTMQNFNQNMQMPDSNIPEQNMQMPDNNVPEQNMQVPDNIESSEQNMQIPDAMMNHSGSMQKDGQKQHGGGMMNGSDDVLLKYIDDDFDSYSNIFNNAKIDITDTDKERLISSLKNLSNEENLADTVDIDAVIRYFVVHNFVLNFDSYTGSMIHNYYLYEKDGQLQMLPWDYNLAFGGFQSSGGASNLVNYPIDSPVSGGSVEDRPMIAWIFENEEYTELYHQYFEEFITEYFDSGYFEEMIDNVISMISPYVEKDHTKFCTYEEFETGSSTLKEFCLLRAESITGQLNGIIGSTSETQNTSTFVDAGNIQISDMGSMNHSMGGERKENFDFKNESEKEEFENSEKRPDNRNFNDSIQQSDNKIFDNSDSGDFMKQNDNNFSDKKDNIKSQMPEKSERNKPSENAGNFSNKTQQSNAIEWVWLGISLAAMITGLGFALKFKRRK